MKLLLITAVEEFEKEVKKILKHSGVKVFSYQSVKGFKNQETDLENWFGIENTGIDSLLFIVFIKSDCADDIYKKVEEFNSNQYVLSRIHIASVALEKFI
ncbi:MAG: hypothetical protein LBE36_00675 [Flavobacteriaceae bacterium]|jgi:nitrogen regulatory protein PII|nr:hypothetical protein [Flavobacteriaceae bacterium]